MSTNRVSPLSRTLALVAPTVVLVAQQASGAFETFIKIGDIKGESVFPKHEDWISGLKFSFDVSKKITRAAETGEVTLGDTSTSELVVVKPLDRSSPGLFLGCAEGTQYPEVILELVNTTVTSSAFYRIRLSDVYVSKISQAGSKEDDKPVEAVSLNFYKIKIEYFVQDPKGGTSEVVPPVEWDLSGNKKG